MTSITLKLFGPLRNFLPDDARRNAASVDVDDAMTVGGLIEQMNLPRESCHLVIVNGHFIPPEERPGRTLIEGDTLAIWPPVAGG